MLECLRVEETFFIYFTGASVEYLIVAVKRFVSAPLHHLTWTSFQVFLVSAHSRTGVRYIS